MSFENVVKALLSVDEGDIAYLTVRFGTNRAVNELL
jgi:hypothetical protein